MSLNKSSMRLDDHDKALLCKGLRFAATPNWSQSVENAEWLNVQQHLRRTNGVRCWEKRMMGLCVAKKLKFPKFMRPESGKIDE